MKTIKDGPTSMRIGIVKKISIWKQKDALLTTMWAATSNLRKHKILQ